MSEYEAIKQDFEVEKQFKLDGSLPANPVNDRRTAKCCDAQKYFLPTVKSAIIQKYLIMEPPEKLSQKICQLNISWNHKTLSP